MRRSLLFLVLVCVSIGVAACSKPEDSRPNVVVIVIDTVRADHLPFYGYAKNTAPFLSELATRGTVCETTYSTSSWTAPATASLVTSLYPLQHGVLSGFRATQVRRQTDTRITLDRIPEPVQTVAEVLQDAGYATFAVTDNPNICNEMGFAQGFDRFQNFHDEGAAVVNRAVLAWSRHLESADPYFLYLHYMDPHRPYVNHDPGYQPVGDERRDAIAAYDSEIAFVDGKIRELYEHFGWDENTLLVVTSDHGEEFQEHGGWDHGRTLYGEVLDVPLVFVFPQGVSAVDRLSAGVSILDVMPTIRNFVGLPPSGQDQGISLLAACGGEKLASDRLHFADLRAAPWFGNLVLQSVVRGPEKLIVTRPDRHELYDLAADPGETRNLADSRPDDVAALWQDYQDRQAHWIQFDPEKVETTLDEEQIEKLKSLGYVR